MAWGTTQLSLTLVNACHGGTQLSFALVNGKCRETWSRISLFSRITNKYSKIASCKVSTMKQIVWNFMVRHHQVQCPNLGEHLCSKSFCGKQFKVDRNNLLCNNQILNIALQGLKENHNCKSKFNQLDANSEGNNKEILAWYPHRFVLRNIYSSIKTVVTMLWLCFWHKNLQFG